MWTLRTQVSHDALRKECEGLSAKDREAKLMQHGLNTLDHAFAKVPGVLCNYCPMDLMHIEAKGNLEAAPGLEPMPAPPSHTHTHCCRFTSPPSST